MWRNYKVKRYSLRLKKVSLKRLFPRIAEIWQRKTKKLKT